MQSLTLSKVNDGVYRLLSSQGEHLGNLKLIQGRWKFKAVGYGNQGEVIPGGGPLTGKHNMVFAALDEAVIAAALTPGCESSGLACVPGVSSTPVVVRPAQAVDLPFFASVEARAAGRFAAADLPIALRGKTMPIDSLRSSQLAGLAWTAIAAPEQIVGFLVAGKTSCGIHIHEMSVLPSYGGAGAGTALLAAVTAVARHTGCERVTLTTFSHIPWNGPFYLSRGFRMLEPDQCPPELRQRLDAEADAGLRNRVAMCKDVT